MNRTVNSKLLVRLLVLIFSVTIISLLILTKCGVGELSTEYYQTGKDNANVVEEPQNFLPNTETQRSPNALLTSWNLKQQKRESLLKQTIRNLTEKINSLQNDVMNMKMSLAKAEEQLSANTAANKDYMLTSSHSSSIYDCTSFIRKQVGAAEILHGLPLNNEYELVPYNHFTHTRIYPIELGLGKRVVEKPIGYRRRDLLEAINRAVDSINRNLTARTKSMGVADEGLRYLLDDFIEGIYRIEPTTGTQYELYFRQKPSSTNRRSLNNLSTENLLNDKSFSGNSNGVIKVIVMRPFAPIQTIQMTTRKNADLQRELIHIILPLSGRLAKFRGFVEKFVKIVLKNDKRVQLTVVYFGEEGLSEARNIIEKATKSNDAIHANMTLLALNESFSRAKGLRVGAEQVVHDNKTSTQKDDVLLFLCDVDIVFSTKFLDRCRWNAEPGKKVYYPVVFSLYNPHVIYTLQGREVPAETEQLQISRETGFWRDFGYGMTCQYRSDFLKIRGFDEEIVGWGGEDVMLYRKYIRSKIKIIRATDPGIFHIWHPKVCTGVNSGEQLTADQYRACIRSRALNEASHAQLGFLAFRDDIAADSQKNMKKNRSSSSKTYN